MFQVFHIDTVKIVCCVIIQLLTQDNHYHTHVIDTLTVIAERYDTTLEGCLIAAYKVIKDRKGKMINGVFVKESDLIIE